MKEKYNLISRSKEDLITLIDKLWKNRNRFIIFILNLIISIFLLA